MPPNHTAPSDPIAAYISQFPTAIQKTLTELRQFIQSIVPEASEKISYQMPTFFFKGNLVHFAAFKSHIGFFPGASGVAAFKTELAPYSTSKGTIRFPLDQPLPYSLIEQIVRFRLAENIEKAAKKEKRTK